MAPPYQPSLLRLLHGLTATLAAVAWFTGLLLLLGFDGRWGRLPFNLDGEWIELHAANGVLLTLLVVLFTAYAVTLGAGRLRRVGNSVPLLALALAVGSGSQMQAEWMLDQRALPLVYAVHITAWFVLALAVPLHLITSLRRGGWPLLTSMLRLQIRPLDGPTDWPSQVVRYLRRGR